MKPSVLRLFAALLAASNLFGCVGGGGDPGDGTNQTLAPKIVLTITNPTTGATVGSITPNSPATVTATFTDSKGAPVVGKFVLFTPSDSNLVLINDNPNLDSQNASTDERGVATIQIRGKSLAGGQPIFITASGTVELVAVSTTSDALTVNAAPLTSIQFVSATPSTIGIISVGNPKLPASSVVKFKVVDSSNVPIPLVLLTFDLSTRVGGILLNGAPSGTISQATDTDGFASVLVTAGNIPTPVSVTASAIVGTETFTSQSNQLTITTGRATQDRMSLGPKTHNIEGWEFNGIETDLSVILADRLGNPVPDDTFVNFVSDGAMVNARCATVAGRCTVKFASGNTRGEGKTEFSTVGVTAGRIKVLAWAIGEESFKDYSVAGATTNDNNLYNTGEPFYDLGDVYLDSNENRQYDAGETTLGSGGSSPCDSRISNSPLAPSRANTCDGVWGTAYVRQDTTIILSGSTAYIGATKPSRATDITKSKSATSVTSMGGAGFSPTPPPAAACTGTHTFWAYDVNKNPLPAGTTIKVATGYPSTITPTISPAVVPDSIEPGGTLHILNVSIPVNATTGVCDKALTSPTSFSLEFSTPLAQVSTVTFTVNP